jgi:uncharacterized damage-inducible protein DinB
MTEVERIQEQMKRAFEGEAWHGPAVLEALDGVDAARAARRPIAAAHSIWEITRHIATWKTVVRRRLHGEVFDVPDEMDWPPVPATDEAAWRAAVADLKTAHEQLIEAVKSAPQSRLDEPLVPGGSVGYVQLHGVIQHDLYHAGQIVVLKKAG